MVAVGYTINIRNGPSKMPELVPADEGFRNEPGFGKPIRE